MRSWLFTPGNDRRKVTKALNSAADVVIIDWEDGVPADQRGAAHRLARDLLLSEQAPYRKRIVIRTLCGASDGFSADLTQIEQLNAEGAGIGGILLPKVETREELSEAAALGLPLIALIESAHALEYAPFLPEPASQMSRGAEGAGAIERLALGSLDLLTDLRVPWHREQPLLSYARTRLAVLSRAAGLAPPIDGVFPPLGDRAGFLADAEAARQVGFGGKMLIHPDQIEPANRLFQPDPDEIEYARRVLTAFEEAAEQGTGVVVVDGQMIDAPIVTWARDLLVRN